MAKSKFNPAFYQNFTTNDKGELTYDDNTWKQINARNEAIKKYDDAIKLKQQIQSETEAVIIQSQKEKAGFERMATIGKGAQAVIDPRMWARGAVGLGKMVFGQTIETTVTGGRAIGEQNAATNLYNQSKDLADQAAKIVKTDRPQAEALLKQSQALAEEANKFSQGEATTKIMGADGKLTTKEIIGKSALTGLEIGSVLPLGGVAKGSFVLSKTVPPAVQGTKTVAVGNAITRALGLGDVYQVTKTGLQQGLKQEVKQTIVGQAFKSTLQAPVTAGLMEMADDDGVNNYMGSLLTTGAGAFGLTLGFGYAGRILGNVAGEVTSNIAKKGGTTPTPTPTPTPTTPPTPQKLLPLPQEAIQATTTIDGKVVNLPPSAYTQPALDPNVFEPKAQIIGTTVNEPLPNPYAKLGAFNPETDIPMVDFTETIKANNIDFNPDSTISINATRKAVDDLALLNGNEVGGKKLKINTDDPKYKEIYNNQIKPLVDRINEVDSKVEVGTYRSVHQIDKTQTTSITNLEENTLNTFVDEFKKQYGYPALKTRELNKLKKVMSNPEADIKIYKASPVNELNNGDWVTIDKSYANDIKKQNGGKVYTYTVKAKDLLYPNTLEEFNNLPSLNKWGAFQYNDPNLKLATTQPAVEKIPVEDVEMEVQKIYSELENAGLNITPEKVRYTPNIDRVDEKLARGEQLNPDEFNKGMQEYVNSTGKTEVIDGVQEELTNPMRKSTYVEKLKKQNPDLNIESVLYEAAIVKDLEEKAINLIDTNFDEAGRIAKNITKSSNPQQVKVAELYMKKLLELGKNDEYAQLTHRFGKASSQAGQWNGILRPHKMGTPEYAIKQAQNTRLDKLEPDIKKQVAKVKQEMSSVKVDQTFLFDILDNITCK